ncbi:MAG: BspA family leucine-rich repeat surface protein, partial [Bacteroidaceae bacterium]|nr:BspA family leucine-rich repeat surface protein [Bacteroidaceae bacterium]
MAQEAYAVMSKDSTTLTFYYDNKKASREGTAYELNPGENRPELEKTKDHIILYINDNDNFTTVVFDGSFKDARPISCAHWFDGFKNLKKIEGIENLNTSNVTDISGMFYGCENLTSLDVSKFNTSNVTDMCGMFSECNNLKSLDVSNFNTSNVTNMHGMFSGCKSLTS